MVKGADWYKEQVRKQLQVALDTMKEAKKDGVILEFSLNGAEIVFIEAYQKV